MEFEIKRNSLKNTRLMYTVLVRFYFSEKSEADRNCRPRQFQVNRDFGQDGRRKYDLETSEGVPWASAYFSLVI